MVDVPVKECLTVFSFSFIAGTHPQNLRQETSAWLWGLRFSTAALLREWSMQKKLYSR